MGSISIEAVAAVRALIDRTPALRAVLDTIVDTRERRGRLPGRITVEAGGDTAGALAELVSARAIAAAGSGRVRIDLARADQVCRAQLGGGLDELLYAVLDRAPRDPAAEDAALVAEVARGLASIRTESGAARAFLAAESDAPTSDTMQLARKGTAAAAIAEAELIARCIDAALACTEPVRLANFAARVLGDSKALTRGDRLRRVARALLTYHDPTLEAVYLGGGEISLRQALLGALEVHGIYRDEATLTVTCFGPLVYRKGRERFDHVARHAELGEPVPLSLAQLRGAAADALPVERVLVIENQTPFLDYVDWLHSSGQRRELVVFSGGQAGWAVVQLLRMVARARIPIAHSGDLDRSGVLILRSLNGRLFTPVTPVAMDVATYRRFIDRGRELSDSELGRLRDLVGRDDPTALGADLLRAILDSGVWIEQERFFVEAVIGSAGHHVA